MAGPGPTVHFPSTLVVQTNLCFAFSNTTEEGHNGVLRHPLLILTGLQRRDCSTHEWSNHPRGVWFIRYLVRVVIARVRLKSKECWKLQRTAGRETSCCEDLSRQLTKSCSRAFTVPSLVGWQMQRRKVRDHAKCVPC